MLNLDVVDRDAVVPIEEDMVEWRLTEIRDDLDRLQADILLYGYHGQIGARKLKGKWEGFIAKEIRYFLRGMAFHPERPSLARRVVEHLTEIRALFACEKPPYTRFEDIEEALACTQRLLALAPRAKVPPLALRQ